MNKKGHLFLRAFVLILLSLAVPIPSYALKFNVDPSKLTFVIKEGERKRDYITVTNLDPESKIHVKGYVRDIIYLPDGSNDFPTAGSTPWSCADWVKFNPSEFDIATNGEQIVKLEVKVPPEAKGGHYGVVFFEVQPAREEKEAQSMANVALRIGTLVLVNVKDTVIYNAKILHFTAKPDEKKGGYTGVCSIQNNGNVLIKPAGTIRILNDKGEKLLERDVNPTKTGVLPNTSKEFSVLFENGKLEKGSYAVQAVIDYGGDVLLGGQTSISVD